MSLRPRPRPTPEPQVQVRVRSMMREGRPVIVAALYVKGRYALELATLDGPTACAGGGAGEAHYIAWLGALQDLATAALRRPLDGNPSPSGGGLET